MDNLAKALGERIRTQRKARRISQDALALACSIDRSYMGRIERGEVNITVEKLYRIASELACEPSSLLPQMSELYPSI
ncbi:anaerobic benzoate catabolism transcriptional regulator [compost metagenome]